MARIAEEVAQALNRAVEEVEEIVEATLRVLAKLHIHDLITLLRRKK